MSESEWIPRLMQEKVLLERKCIALEMANEKLAAELAELKAKMEGVVPVDRELLDFAVSEQFLLFCDEEEFLDIAKSVLGRFARLNSSTVSAGDDAQYPPCDYCAEPLSYHPWHGSGLINGVESRHIHACDKCRHLLPAASAGDERSAFEAWMVEVEGVRIKPRFDRATAGPFAGDYRDGQIQGSWNVWQARAALSANHSEQVRVPDVDLAIHLLSDRWPESSERIEVEVFAEWLRDLLAAAPSAGSQEKGE